MNVAAEQFPNEQDQPDRAGMVLFPNLYLWLVFFASLDIVLTRFILFFSGTEINPIADLVIKSFGVPGMSIFKFSVVTFVILVCEIVGRTRRVTAHKLAVFAVIITGFPVVWSTTLLASIIVRGGELPPIEDDPTKDRMEAVEYAAPPQCEFAIVTWKTSSEGRAGQWIQGSGGSESSFLVAGLAAPTWPSA